MAASERKIRDAFAAFPHVDDRIALVSAGETTCLSVNGHELSVIDPLEGTPLVMAMSDTADAAALAERVNERIERVGGATFAQLLELLTSCVAKRPCTASSREASSGSAAAASNTTPATAHGRRRTTGHNLEDEDEAAITDAAVDDEGDDDDDEQDDLEDESLSLAADGAATAHGAAPAGDASGGSESTRKPPGAAEAFRMLQASAHGKAVSLSKRMQVGARAVRLAEACTRPAPLSSLLLAPPLPRAAPCFLPARLRHPSRPEAVF